MALVLQRRFAIVFCFSGRCRVSVTVASVAMVFQWTSWCFSGHHGVSVVFQSVSVIIVSVAIVFQWPSWVFSGLPLCCNSFPFCFCDETVTIVLQ